ncbi:alpha/beta family hydrolase [Kineococcus gynurae]|uniref:Alpha/beta family hydrolase n=1 Tax=Kineococcus gynurae TaxID=452979 RepID=A0ABV5LP83_9ACTN
MSGPGTPASPADAGPRWGLLLAPGAGAGSDAPGLVALAEAAPPWFAVHRMDFPYRLAGRRAPDRAPVLLAALREAAAGLAAASGLPPHRLVLGGRSMGGRMASMAVAEGLPAAGLLLVSYPLHPPGRPEKLRTEHLPTLRLPCLFVSGDRDTFGTPAELTAETAVVPGRDLELVPGGDHGLRRREHLAAELAGAWLRRRFPR